MSKLEAKVAAVNRCHEYAAQLYAKLTQFFKEYEGQKVVKVDGCLLAKIADKLGEIEKPLGINAWRKHCSFSLTYGVSASVTSNGIAMYHETSFSVGQVDNQVLTKVYDRPYNLRTDYTVEEVLAKREAYKQARIQADNCLSDLRDFG
jgi:hypothetical protein